MPVDWSLTVVNPINNNMTEMEPRFACSKDFLFRLLSLTAAKFTARLRLSKWQPARRLLGHVQSLKWSRPEMHCAEMIENSSCRISLLTPFHSIPFHSIPFHSIPFHSCFLRQSHLLFEAPPPSASFGSFLASSAALKSKVRNNHHANTTSSHRKWTRECKRCCSASRCCKYLRFSAVHTSSADAPLCSASQKLLDCSILSIRFHTPLHNSFRSSFHALL
jgi:hypothetical protein